MSINKLTEQIKDLDWDAIETMQDVGQAAVPQVIPMLKHPDPEVRQIALACLNVTGGDEAIKVALRSIQDEDETVVSEAVYLLHNHPPTGHDKLLFTIYCRTDNMFLKEEIPKIIGRLDASTSIQPWADAFNAQDLSPDERKGLTVGLARLKYEPAQAMFVQQLHNTQGQDSKEWIDYCIYMNDTWILKHMGPLLDRTEKALILLEDRNIYLRTCDLAARAIFEIAKVQPPFLVNRPEQFSQDELAYARQIIKGMQ